MCLAEDAILSPDPSHEATLAQLKSLSTTYT